MAHDVPNMKPSLDLDALKSFDVIALHGGLGAATRATGRPKATLSRHLAELERDLKVRLVERGERRLKLTEEGRRFHERTHGLLLDIADAADAVSSGSDVPRGLLRVSAPMVLAHVTLMPVANRFCALYPDVTLDLIAEDRRVDPVEDGYDVVIRIDPGPDDRLVGRRIAYDQRLIVAAHGIGSPGEGAVIEAKAVMMATSTATTSWRMRKPDGSLQTILPQARLRLSSLLMVRNATIEGLGVALLPKLLVQSDIDAGRLTCWGVADGPPVEIWALHSSRRLISAKVRAFLDVLAEPDAMRGRGQDAV
ncbi:DNA-binding transcriptional regulator, LysR family [Sphingomonas sp. OK281]|nr:DNA-binding transcriptional regulator, LysR family [Sphingomonas sp. OK281]